MADKQQAFDLGMKLRHDMFGPEGAEMIYANLPEFLRPLQDVVTTYCFGEGWSRPGIDLKTRSMLTLAILVALGKPNQLRTHVEGALANGVSVEEIREVLMHAMIYCGVPAAVEAFTNAADVLRSKNKLE